MRDTAQQVWNHVKKVCKEAKSNNEGVLIGGDINASTRKKKKKSQHRKMLDKAIKEGAVTKADQTDNKITFIDLGTSREERLDEWLLGGDPGPSNDGNNKDIPNERSSAQIGSSTTEALHKLRLHMHLRPKLRN